MLAHLHPFCVLSTALWGLALPCQQDKHNDKVIGTSATAPWITYLGFCIRNEPWLDRAKDLLCFKFVPSYQIAPFFQVCHLQRASSFASEGFFTTVDFVLKPGQSIRTLKWMPLGMSQCVGHGLALSKSLWRSTSHIVDDPRAGEVSDEPRVQDITRRFAYWHSLYLFPCGPLHSNGLFSHTSRLY